MATSRLRGRGSAIREEAKKTVKRLQRQTFHTRKTATGRDLISVTKLRKATADKARKDLRQSKFFG